MEDALRKSLAFSSLLLLVSTSIPLRAVALADEGDSNGASAAAKAPANPAAPTKKSETKKSETKKSETLFAVGIGVKASTLGIGGEVAFPVTHRSNVRFGFNAFNYSHTFDKDNVTYKGSLDLRSAQATWDLFLGKGFHLSPGVLLYNGNKISANASVPGGKSFTLNNVNYVSDSANPVSGTGKLDLNKAAPMLLLGFGNLVPRNHRHLSVTFELGAAYQGSPRVTLNFNGNVCDSNGLNCRAISSDPTVLANIQKEQTKINKSASPFRFYPVISLGFGYRF
jgi:hypothetical protein